MPSRKVREPGTRPRARGDTGGTMSIKGHLAALEDVRPKLTVIGVGGAGCNAVNNMIASGLDGVDFVVANTDAQALASSAAEHRIQLGATLTEGLGAGSRPEIGEAAAEEAIEDIRKQIAGSHMVFIAAGMGGGTGTGAASVIARVAREQGILTVGVVTKPFLFEGARRMRVAEAGVAELRNYVDTLIVIPNQNLFRIASDKTTFSEAFVMADQVLYSGVACIVDLIIKEGLINLDFADVRTVMSGMGSAMMGTGEATGERRATIAAEEAISNPLLDDVSLRGAKGLLLSITGGPNLTLYEVDEAASRVRQEVDPEANIIVGATYDPAMGERVRVSIVASGMARQGESERAAPGNADAWIRALRGTNAPAPAQPPYSAAQQAAKAPEAQRSHHQAAQSLRPAEPQAPAQEGGDVSRRITEALQSPAATMPPPPQTGGWATSSREGWRAPGNVMIQDGPPQLPGANPPHAYSPPQIPGQGMGPPMAPMGHAGPAASHGGHHGGFEPQAPAEMRRQPPRMPDVGDFPPVGQRAYYAAKDGSSEPQRRMSLFERITGRMRGAPDHQVPHHPADHGTVTDPRIHYEMPPEDAQGRRLQAGDNRNFELNQDTDMPMFFNKHR